MIFIGIPRSVFRSFAPPQRLQNYCANGVLTVRTGIGGTGVVGILRGRREGNRTLGFRAELDALPMIGRANTDYKSTRDGVFHGCGHDGHAATLLGAARHLATNNDFAGTIYFIFQPAEETLRGGVAMMADGLFDIAPVEEIYALHNNPGLAVGNVEVQGRRHIVRRRSASY